MSRERLRHQQREHERRLRADLKHSRRAPVGGQLNTGAAGAALGPNNIRPYTVTVVLLLE